MVLDSEQALGRGQELLGVLDSLVFAHARVGYKLGHDVDPGLQSR